MGAAIAKTAWVVLLSVNGLHTGVSASAQSTRNWPTQQECQAALQQDGLFGPAVNAFCIQTQVPVSK